MASRRTVLWVFPAASDRRLLAELPARVTSWCDVILAEPGDADCPVDLDVAAWLEDCERRYRGVDGVATASDCPGAPLAALLAERLDLPGPPALAVLRSGHKYYSRLTQREVVPQSTPRFRLIDPADPRLEDLPYPCWIKPVKGAFSVLSGRADRPEEACRLIERPAVPWYFRESLSVFHQALARCPELKLDARRFLAEELLEGEQVTVEGFAIEGEVEVIAVVDSVFHPGTRCFAGFDHPSVLPARVQERMREVARRLVPALGLERTLFNIEMIWNPAADTVHVLEVNPRMCNQFSDLYAKVDGTGGHELALTLAAGRRPTWRPRQGRFQFASSVALRAFSTGRVIHSPDADAIAAEERAHPGLLVQNECVTGQVLDDFDRYEDGASFRYALLNLGARSRAELRALAVSVERRLGWRFEESRGQVLRWPMDPAAASGWTGPERGPAPV